jgi:hypothetical protein
MLIGLGIWGFSLPPVRITDDGLVVGGRNRLCASIRLGKDVKFERFNPSDPIQYVLSENLERRHLTSQQKAAIAIQADDLYKLLAEQAKEAQLATLKQNQTDTVVEKISQRETSNPDDNKTRQKIAKTFGTNQNYVSKAKKVKNHAPELLSKVASGEVDLNDAAKEAGRRKKDLTGAQAEINSIPHPPPH